MRRYLFRLVLINFPRILRVHVRFRMLSFNYRYKIIRVLLYNVSNVCFFSFFFFLRNTHTHI